MRIYAPQHTQTPNELFDDWLPKLTFVQLKVLMVIIRKTFGWHKVRDRISITQLETLTGAKRQAIIKAAKDLEKMGLITKIVIGSNGQQQTFYELVVIEDSKNSYQCDQHTPTSVINTPTKETLSKEKEIREEAAPPPPLFLYKRVRMESEKSRKLVEDFGEEKVKEMMERLDEYADINPKRFKQYACHATVLRKWIREDKEKNNSKPQGLKEKNRLIAQKICSKFKHPEIETTEDGINFVNHGAGKSVFILYNEFSFKDQVELRLRKMGLNIAGI